MRLPYSKITSKGQLTVPVEIRKKYRLKPGTKVLFEEKEGEVVLKTLPDIIDSAGSLSKFADADEVILNLLKERKRPFR